MHRVPRAVAARRAAAARNCPVPFLTLPA
jgi:hypothetical protein